MNTTKECPNCCGTGMICYKCNGSGEIVCNVCDGTHLITLVNCFFGHIVSYSRPCGSCSIGYVSCPEHYKQNEIICPQCTGTGRASY